MFTIVVVCGAGITASARLAERIRAHVDRSPYEAHIVQATVMDLLSQDFRADLIVSTVEIPEALGIPVVSGMPVMLETRPEVTFAQIDRWIGAAHARSRD